MCLRWKKLVRGEPGLEHTVSDAKFLAQVSLHPTASQIPRTGLWVPNLMLPTLVL